MHKLLSITKFQTPNIFLTTRKETICEQSFPSFWVSLNFIPIDTVGTMDRKTEKSTLKYCKEKKALKVYQKMEHKIEE